MLAVGHEHLGLRRRLERLLHVADDADDLHRRKIRRRLGAELDPLPERIAIGKELPRHRLVDHHDARRPVASRCRQHAARAERHAERRAGTRASTARYPAMT